MKYRFRLETVLQVRRAEETSARGALVRADRALVSAIEDRDRAQERYGRIGAAGVTEVEELRRERSEGELAAQATRHAQRMVSRAASEAALAHVTWSSCARRVAMLERLDERWRAEHAQDEERKSVAAIDDLVSARYAAERQHAEVLARADRRMGARP